MPAKKGQQRMVLGQSLRRSIFGCWHPNLSFQTLFCRAKIKPSPCWAGIQEFMYRRGISLFKKPAKRLQIENLLTFVLQWQPHGIASC